MPRLLRLVSALTVCCSVPLHAAADMPLGAVGPGGDVYAGAAARTIRGIMEYARWNERRDPTVLCVAGPAQHAGQIGGWRMADGRQVVRRNVSPAPSALAGCDVLYLGALSIATQRQLTAAVRGRGVLTIAEADPDNASDAMFAFTYKPNALSFRLNIDAVSRSGMKIDPRVLRVAQGGV